MIEKPPESQSDPYLNLRTRVLREMRHRDIEESIRELVQEAYREALGSLGVLSLVSQTERARLGKLIQDDLLIGMVAKD